MDLPILTPVADPELEEIRTKDVPGPPDIVKRVEDWIAKSSQYSLKKLTSGNEVGWKILHIVARFVDGTPVGANGDWKHLAALLGLDIHDIVRIENFSTIKGATLEILSLYALKADAKLSKLLETLRIMEREDILFAISGHLEALLNSSSISIHSNDIDSGMDSGMEISVVGEADPENLKSVPLRSASMAVDKNMIDHSCSSADISDYDQVKGGPVKKNYVKTVLLTFAQDGYELAKQVAHQIRSLNLGIGVLILEENRDELEFCSESIYRWYQEVDFIIPIITEDYLWQISPRVDDENMNRSESTCIDARYVRLIYIMMLEEYQRNCCLNYRVRPIESDTLVNRAPLHFLLRNPIFSCRKSVKQVDKLASILAQAKIRPMIR